MTDQNSQFFAILTAVGEAKQANADALGVPWTFSQMGVGDANGIDPVPSRTQNSLINERRRAPLNQLKVDPQNLNVIIAEQVIPPDVGGWWIREIGLYDTDGDLVAVANCAPSFKPLLSQGTGKTQVVRLNIIVTSTANVQLKIDPSVVLATREWVTEELAKQDFKHSVLAATTANIALSGLQTVDGVVLTPGARVLVKNQATAKDNGLYLVVAGGAWTRCTDADASIKVTPGLLVSVEKGTANADSAWQLVTDGPITLGVTALVFEMAFGRTGVAGTYRSVTVDKYGRVVAATNPTTLAGYGITDALSVFSSGAADIGKIINSSVVYQNPSAGHLNPLGPAAGPVLTVSFADASGFQLYGRDDSLLFRGHSGGAYGQVRTVWHTGNFDPLLKANLVSPTFTGLPLAPTAAVGTNNTQLATTAFVQVALSRLVDSSPGALDTLRELAAALGNDANFSATVMAQIATKADKATTLAGYGITDAMAKARYATLSESAALDLGAASFFLLNATAGARDFQLPASVVGLTGVDLIVRRLDNSGNRLVVKASGSDKIRFHTHLRGEGYPFFVLMGAGDYWHLRCDGQGSWWPISRYDNTALGRPVFETTMELSPGGYGLLNGPVLVRSEWPWLWDHAQQSGMLTTEAARAGMEGGWTSGDGAQTFRGPEGRSEFFRVLDESRGVDAGRVAGSGQGSANLSHDHKDYYLYGGAAAGTTAPTGSYYAKNYFANNTNIVLTSTTDHASSAGAFSRVSGGAESRPRNIALPGRIKMI